MSIEERLDKIESMQRIVPPWQLMDVQTAARTLDISPSKLYEMVEKGEIEHHRLGGSIKFTMANLDDLLKKTKRERKTESVERKAVPRPALKHVRIR